ncbi:MAG: sigma-70 family RNA polymerase sigma factor [Armatimonadetes bacterium]|nr:sigma-70 family RNA polymerase sigma factor [Armatimonadota bacterium]
MANSGGLEDLDRILQKCKRGDAQAWASLVDALQAHVYSVAKRAGLSDDDAEDVFQTTFLALHRSLDRVESGWALPRWLATTASREALRLRRSKHCQTLPIDRPDLGLDQLLADEEASAAEEAERADTALHVRTALLELKLECQKLLMAVFSEDDLSYQDISVLLGIPMGSIGPQRARCLERLRKILENRGFFDET